ncbi:MAG: hypothetical protein AB1797_09800 [bacterium]
MPIFILLTITLILTFNPNAYGSSIFGIDGLGEPESTYSARAEGMGGAGMAIADDAAALAINPAGLSQIKGFRLFLPFKYEKVKVNSQSSAVVPLISVISPFPQKVTLGFGIIQRYDFNLETGDNSFTLEETEIKRRVERKGSINAYSLAASVAFRDRVSLGLNLNKLIGSSQETWITDFDDAEYIDAEDIIKVYYSSGLNLELSTLIRIRDDLNLATVIELPSTLKARTKVKSRFESEDKLEDEAPYSEEAKIDMPISYGLGAAYRPGGKRLTMALDFDTTLWPRVKIDGERNPYLMDTGTLYLGAEYELGGGGRHSFQGSKLRLGYQTGTWYHTYKKTQTVKTRFITAGAGFLFRSGQVDFSVGFGRRADESKEIKEDVIRFLVSFNLIPAEE